MALSLLATHANALEMITLQPRQDHATTDSVHSTSQEHGGTMHPLNFTEPEIRQRTWIELQRAIQDRDHGWRTPVLATVGKDGTPSARTVVLRDADATLQSLQFFTDRRSPKISERLHQPAAMLVFWSGRLSLNDPTQAKLALMR